MRQIKFRGKRKDKNEWVYGSYQACVGDGTMSRSEWKGGNRTIFDDLVHFDNHWIMVARTPSDPGWTISDTYCAYSILPETIGQFTGLTDKSGREIYEGDVCRGPNGKHWVIQWEGHSWTMTNEMIPNGKMKFGGTETYTIDRWLHLPPRSQYLEVIGNIHEHSHLLTANTQDK